MVDDLFKDFLQISFQQLLRIDKKATDAMKTLASLLKMPKNDFQHEFLVETLHYLAYDSPESQMIYLVIGHDSSCYHHLYSYLHDQVILDTYSQNKKFHLIHSASRYVLIAEDLYRHGLDGTLLRCLEPNKSKCALAKVHEGICGSHLSNSH